MTDAAGDSAGRDIEMQASPSSARATIIALRKARPHADIFALYQDYEADSRNKPIGWLYFLSVCRQVDSFTKWKLGKLNAP